MSILLLTLTVLAVIAISRRGGSRAPLYRAFLLFVAAVLVVNVLLAI
jgi:hypothetical protein